MFLIFLDDMATNSNCVVWRSRSGWFDSIWAYRTEILVCDFELKENNLVALNHIAMMCGELKFTWDDAFWKLLPLSDVLRFLQKDQKFHLQAKECL